MERLVGGDGMITTPVGEILKELARKQPRITRIDDRWGKGRHYRVEGIEARLPSVTTILNVINKPALVPWATKTALENVRKALLANPPGKLGPEEYGNWIADRVVEARQAPEKVRDTAADFGTRLHALIDEYLKSDFKDSMLVTDEMNEPFSAFQNWYRDSGLTIHQSEFMVYSKRGYAGTVDAIATRWTPEGEELVVVDWKTSNAIYPEMAFQVAAYAEALEEMLDHRWPVTEAWVLRLGKDKPEFEARMAPKHIFGGFEGALSLFNGLAKVKNEWK